MDLYCLNYNNYYNRIIKKEDDINGYLPYLLDDVITKINFNPNDGVSTTQILNWKVASIPDYIVVADTNQEIISRWFVIEMSRTRTGQYSLILRRDLIADNYIPIINAPCFIEKATLNQDDPMIFNSEDMTFNQIKTSETLLKDRTGCGWIVGYYARDYVDSTDSSKSLTLDGYTIDRKADIELDGDITDWDYYQFTQEEAWKKPSKVYYSVDLGEGPYDFDGVIKYLHLNYKFNSSSAITPEYGGYTTTVPGYKRLDKNLTANEISANMTYLSMDYLIDRDYSFWQTSQKIQEIINLNGKIIGYIKNDVNVYKKIKLKILEKTNSVRVLPNSDLGERLTAGLNAIKQSGKISGEANNTSYALDCTGTTYQIILEEYSGDTITANIASKLNRYNVVDQPYAMFAIPYGEITIKNTGNEDWTNFITSPSIALATAYGFAEKYSGSGTLYDLQLLPYCPMQNIISDDLTIDLANDSRLYSIIKNDVGQNRSVILNCLDNTFSLNINYNIEVVNKKIENLTDMYRLCSPNFNGNFEFSASKNDGIQYFNIDCEYRPFKPYIHINPNFRNLYGNDFNDARGLICGGDFTLTQISDNWNTYQIQNKNYQDIFNRQIQNMEVNNSVQKEKDIWDAVSGSVQGTVAGAVAGGMMGGGYGAIAGAVVGGVSSVAGGIRDIQLNEKLRNEAIDYTRDQFGYQLGNIKALPDNLTQVSSFNPNNKIFPILEFYTCTEIEKKALTNKLKYNGMTVMRIGTIAEFMQVEPSYIKGKLIRLDGISDDFHILNEIANEIYKGVYI